MTFGGLTVWFVNMRVMVAVIWLKQQCPLVHFNHHSDSRSKRDACIESIWSLKTLMNDELICWDKTFTVALLDKYNYIFVLFILTDFKVFFFFYFFFSIMWFLKPMHIIKCCIMQRVSLETFFLHICFVVSFYLSGTFADWVQFPDDNGASAERKPQRYRGRPIHTPGLPAKVEGLWTHLCTFYAYTCLLKTISEHQKYDDKSWIVTINVLEKVKLGQSWVHAFLYSICPGS